MRTLSLTLPLLITAAVGAQGHLAGLAGAVLNAKVAPKFNTYQVRRGDTLFSIAERFYGTGNGYWKVIAAVNDIKPDELKPGTILKIPVNPGKALGLEPTGDSDTAGTKEKKETKPKGPTVGETLDALNKRISALTGAIGLKFKDGPAYAFKVVGIFFLACLLYVAADALMVWLGSLLLRIPDPTLGQAGKVSVSSLGLQILFVLGLLMLGAVVNQIWPDTATVDRLRSLSWSSRTVLWPVLLSGFLAFVFIPFAMVKQTYGVTPGKAGGVTFLAVCLKVFIAFFPGAIAFVATGGPAAVMLPLLVTW